ncbi:MAG TPA: kelch repeat-containing protein [Ramlibacter sp.]|jgi:N-acetylneuraminic acid mutarotase|uniref:Kelch repeat-containing protein n=1 Tax=Ramlibacter sp. TaxID=1917967 RepID=UPI002D758BDC|nr:kelch repeat-containing protein [Ramlibacter sp.]HZY19633.1 kelch repeat-containing protein [Ramlibacter sp.]
MPTRRRLLLAAPAVLAGCVQPATGPQGQPDPHAAHHGLFERLNQPGRTGLPAQAAVQHVFDSPAPRAARPGRWAARAALPLPRSEMAWAVALQGRLHLVGGYGEQRVDRPYHHAYDPATDRWSPRAPLPLGANHVGVAAEGDTLYAVGGFIEQNRKPHAECFAWSARDDRWRRIAPLPQPCGATACVMAGGVLHVIGGAVGDTFETKRSVDWHLVYDAGGDRWRRAAPLPTARDHTGTVAANGLIHVIGGRVDSFHTNSNLHHSYDPRSDQWTMRHPLPTARSGHGAVLVGGRIFVMGGEGTNRVFGQNEAYDIAQDGWQHYAPMPTPRHGLGAAAIGDTIHVAGGGPVMGGGVQSAVHEAFTVPATAAG